MGRHWGSSPGPQAPSPPFSSVRAVSKGMGRVCLPNTNLSQPPQEGTSPSHLHGGSLFTPTYEAKTTPSHGRLWGIPISPPGPPTAPGWGRNAPSPLLFLPSQQKRGVAARLLSSTPVRSSPQSARPNFFPSLSSLNVPDMPSSI